MPVLVRVMCTTVPQEVCQRKGITARTVQDVLVSNTLFHCLCCPECTQTPHPIVPVLLEILFGTVLIKREMEEARVCA